MKKVNLVIKNDLLDKIHAYCESVYPSEAAGLLLGKAERERKIVERIVMVSNSRESSAQHNRYLITPQDMLAGEKEAMRWNLDVVGIFHSHPDHPNRPSEFDRQWALPWYSYIITCVQQGIAIGSRSWRLADDRSAFEEERMEVIYAEIVDS